MTAAKKSNKDAKASDRGARRASRGRHHDRRAMLQLALLVFAVAFAAYANTIDNEFLWDDRDLIVDNPNVKTLDGEMLQRIFTEDFWKTSGRGGGYYRPLTTLSYHLQYKLFNDNPAGFHFANVMWHAITSALVFFFITLLFGRKSLGLVTALLFALHPLHTESVAWVSGRTDVLAALWAMVSMILYVLARRETSWNRGLVLAVISLIAFVMALMAKESVVALPFVFFVMEAPPCGHLVSPGPQHGPRWVHPIAYFGVVGLYLVARHAALGSITSHYDAYADGIGGGIALVLAILAGYAGKLLVPWRLSGEWDVPVPDSFLSWHVLAGVLLVAAMVWLVIRYRRRAEVTLGTALIVLGLAPVLNIIPIGEISAERFAYLPSLGFALTVAALFAPAMEHRFESLRSGDLPSMPRATATNMVWVLAIVLGVYGVRTVTRNAVWQNETKFFAATARATPDSPRAHLNVGNAARRVGNLNDAIIAYKRAIEVDPDYADALANLAGIYAMQGHLDQAEPYALRALKSAPDNVTLLTNLGVLYFQQKKKDKAAAYFERALAIDPAIPMARFNLALIRYQQGNADEARRQFERVAGTSQQFHLAFYYLAEIESAAGNTSRARDMARRFLSTYPESDQYRTRAQAILSGNQSQ